MRNNSNHTWQFTMSVDKTIKVWDLRNHKCLQTIAEVRLVCRRANACPL